MSAPEAPRPPDPAATARAQTQSNRETALAEAQLNRVNEVTPYGGVTYSTTPGHGGIPQYTRTVTESPNQEALRTGQERLGIALGNLAETQTGRVGDLLSRPYDPRRIDLEDATGPKLNLAQALGGDFDLSQFSPTNANLGDIEQQTYDLATRRLGTEFDKAEEGLRTRLANQGITQDSDAFRSELESFNRARGDAYAEAQLGARGVAEQSRAARVAELLAGAGLESEERGTRASELLTGRSTNLEEALRQYGIDTTADLSERTQPLQEIMGILQGTPLTPINPGAIATTGINPTDVAGITQQGFNNALNIYNQQMAQRNALIGAIGGVAGAGFGAI